MWRCQLSHLQRCSRSEHTCPILHHSLAALLLALLGPKPGGGWGWGGGALGYKLHGFGGNRERRGTHYIAVCSLTLRIRTGPAGQLDSKPPKQLIDAVLTMAQATRAPPMHTLNQTLTNQQQCNIRLHTSTHHSYRLYGFLARGNIERLTPRWRQYWIKPFHVVCKTGGGITAVLLLSSCYTLTVAGMLLLGYPSRWYCLPSPGWNQHGMTIVSTRNRTTAPRQ